jgi:hypothetical protein
MRRWLKTRHRCRLLTASRFNYMGIVKRRVDRCVSWLNKWRSSQLILKAIGCIDSFHCCLDNIRLVLASLSELSIETDVSSFEYRKTLVRLSLIIYFLVSYFVFRCLISRKKEIIFEWRHVIETMLKLNENNERIDMFTSTSCLDKSWKMKTVNVLSAYSRLMLFYFLLLNQWITPPNVQPAEFLFSFVSYGSRPFL